jgi:hypothetical protein
VFDQCAGIGRRRQRREFADRSTYEAGFPGQPPSQGRTQLKPIKLPQNSWLGGGEQIEGRVERRRPTGQAARREALRRVLQKVTN